jgi:beta-glucosidase
MKQIIIAVLILTVGNGYGQAKDAKMNQFISALIAKMTIEEKIGQLNLPSVGFDVTGPILSQGVEEKIKKGLVGGVFNTFTPVAVRKLQDIAVKETRLKIPLLFGYDVVHGHRTIFPMPLGLAATWDTILIEKTARAAAEEMSADGLNWTFSPMVDIARDPRWGRVSEGAGEDWWLGSKIARAMVRGYQGTDLSKDNTVLACVKHFALYGASESGRDYNTTDMSRLRMYQEYLPPYLAAVKAGAGSVMTSFNEIDGIPASANKWLLTDLLRKSWGFKGLIVTDYTAINEMMAHGMGDAKTVGALALNAGVDMDMVGEIFLNEGVALVKSGKVAMTQIDAAVRRILEAKYKLGLFDDPYRYVSDEKAGSRIMTPEKLALTKEASMKSMVLLKNAGQVLPLSPDKKIAFIGPLVKDQRNLIGNWSGAGDPEKAVSLWTALAANSTANPYLYAKGCNLLDDTGLLKKLNPHDARIVADPKSPAELVTEATTIAAQADIIVAVLGEAFGMTGEAASRSMIGLPENQLELLKALKKTGKPIVLVLMNGRPLTLSWEDKNMDAILETWYGGTQAGPAINDVLFGKSNPAGRLTMTFPRNVGQIPVYYNAKNTGRPFDENQKYTSKYLDVSNTPLYPFGYGLSYTKFSYSDIRLNKTSINPSAPITATITVTNSGNFDGEEVVQLYIRDLVGSVTRPVMELKGFKKIMLKKGESKQVDFKITLDDCSFFNTDLKWVSEPGDFKVFIGPDSRDVKEASFKY